VSTTTRVPHTATLPGSQLTGLGPGETFRHAGPRTLLTQAFLRFRYGDGFSHSRALALQLVLAVIPLVIAFVGLSTSLGTSRVGETLRRTLLGLTPGSGGDAVSRSLSRPMHGGSGQAALYVGLLAAVVALSTAMGQVERGGNRIYGVQRDRPARQKYLRSTLLALLAGVPALAGFVVVVAGGALADAVDRVYGHDGDLVRGAHYPVGVLLMLGALVVLFQRAPRRPQPTLGWLVMGAGAALVLWLVFSLLLSVYLHGSSAFGTVYGPLTGVIALLLWSQLTSIALLLGVAVSAQLEALRGGLTSAVATDTELFGGATAAS